MKETLRLIPLEDTVVFPNMNMTLAVDVGNDERILLVPRHGTEFASVGVIAEVTDRATLPGGATAVSLFATARGVAGAAHTDADGTLRVQVDAYSDASLEGTDATQLEREYRAVVEEILELRGADERIASFVRSISSPGALADTAGYAPELSYEQKVELLETLDVEERLRRALALQQERLAELQCAQAHPRRRRLVSPETAARVRPPSAARSRSDASWATMTARSLTNTARRSLTPRCPRRSPSRPFESSTGSSASAYTSAEGSVIRTYLDWLLAVPWAARSEDELDVERARAILDEDHAGLEETKDRVVEYLAVRGLRAERGIEDDGRSGAILTLVGPPGTGKTSIGESIARSLGSRVRSDVARRRTRRGRDTRPPTHLHRRASGETGSCAPRRWDDEPGDHAR